MTKKKGGASPPRNYVHRAMLLHAKPGAHDTRDKVKRQQARILLQKGKEVFLTDPTVNKASLNRQGSLCVIHSSPYFSQHNTVLLVL